MSTPAFFRNQTGFTLIETIFALSISTIVLAGLSVVVSTSRASFLSGQKQANLQADFSLIGTLLANSMARSTYGSQQIFKNYTAYKKGELPVQSGNCLKLWFPNKTWQLFCLEGMNFQVVSSNSQTAALIKGTISTLIFTEKGKAIQTEVTLSAGFYRMKGTFTHAFRN